MTAARPIAGPLAATAPINAEPQAPEAALAEAARLLFARPANFVMGVTAVGQLPPPAIPEVAVAGRSNVGKSSLVNALTGQSTLARTSNTPGRTQEVNLFDLGNRLRLVDLPGYGYAEAPKDRVAAWTDLVFAYLRGRPNLRLVALLIDARHGAKPSDEAAMTELARAAVPFQVVLTKADLLGPTTLEQRLAEVRAMLRTRPAALAAPIVTSSRKDIGMVELRAALYAHALPEACEVA